MLVRRHRGPLGWLYDALLTLVTVALLVILRDDDVKAFPHMRFSPANLTKGDESVARFIQFVNSLKVSPWSAKASLEGRAGATADAERDDAAGASRREAAVEPLDELPGEVQKKLASTGRCSTARPPRRAAVLLHEEGDVRAVEHRIVDVRHAALQAPGADVEQEPELGPVRARRGRRRACR